MRVQVPPSASFTIDLTVDIIVDIIMHATAYCTASSFDTLGFYKKLRGEDFSVSINRRVINLHLNPEQNRYAFFFPYGSIVFWNLSSKEEAQFLEMIRPFVKDPLRRYESDNFKFFLGNQMNVTTEGIVIPDTKPLTMHAISHGLAQSVKLGVFEIQAQKTYNETKHIPEELATAGKISLSLRDIRKQMGKLFIERSTINLHFDILDTPEFFWDHSDLEPLYRMVANDLDLSTRVEVLNQRLNVIHELFQMLGNELNNQHSSRLEIIIILLILVEVMLILAKDVLNWI